MAVENYFQAFGVVIVSEDGTNPIQSVKRWLDEKDYDGEMWWCSKEVDGITASLIRVNLFDEQVAIEMHLELKPYLYQLDDDQLMYLKTSCIRS